MRRVLAAALAVALVSAIVRVASAVPSSDEPSVMAADYPGLPGEPPSESPSRLSAEITLAHPIVTAPPPSALVGVAVRTVSRGELHARLPERPPRA